MLWKLFQLAIVFGVACTNIWWQWTDNGYVVALIGAMAALWATLILGWTFDGLSAVWRISGRLRRQ